MTKRQLVEMIQNIRDLLYSLHDALYFDDDDNHNETLTSSMIVAWPKIEPPTFIDSKEAKESPDTKP